MSSDYLPYTVTSGGTISNNAGIVGDGFAVTMQYAPRYEFTFNISFQTTDSPVIQFTVRANTESEARSKLRRLIDERVVDDTFRRFEGYVTNITLKRVRSL